MFFVLDFVVEAILATQSLPGLGFKRVARFISATAALSGTATVLFMPFRHPSLPQLDISTVGQPPSSNFRSPEDNLRLWQFLTVSWMEPLISLGRKRKLNEPDVWLLGFEFQHERLNEKFRQLKGSVLGRVLRANIVDVFIILAVAVVQIACELSTPVLLQQLLRAMEDPGKSKRIPLTYALFWLLIRLIATQSQVLNIWYGRRCYERSRGEMVMMVYEKALSRKNILGIRLDGPEDRDGTADGEGAALPVSKRRKLWGWLPFVRDTPKEKPAKEAASLGKIFNLLRGDVYEVAQRFWEVGDLIDKPVGLMFAIFLVWRLFGPSCFLGIVAVLVGQVLNAVITRYLLRWEKIRRAATDARLQITSQFVEAIRHLRWNELRIDVIFPALQLFTMLETRLRDIPSLITSFINATIALGRIEDFMSEPDKAQLPLDGRAQDSHFEMQSCSFAWPGKLTPVLKDVSIQIPTGLTVVTGKVGAGKTALLQSFLGELDLISGQSKAPSEMIGYCSQSPWLQSMSIRDNILFSAPYQDERYKRTLEACALLPDLSQFKHGDLTFIGENGVGLSGGQKARVALARAVYSSSRILLLDDPISALDHNTAEFVIRKCFAGPLMQGRTIVLVTHRTALVKAIADQVLEIKSGFVTVYDKATMSNILGEDDTDISHSNHGDEDLPGLEDEANAVPDKFIEDEHRAEWGVQARVYWNYIRAGRYRWWITLVLVLTVYRLSAVGQSWFLKGWGEAYNRSQSSLFEVGNSNQHSSMIHFSPFMSTIEGSFLPQDPVRALPSPRDDVRPWLWTFFAIVSFLSVTLLISQLLMVVVVYCAGKTLFHQVIVRVSHATFRFFDVTPVGRLMNRLTSDIGVVDGNISEQFQAIAFQAITWVSSILVIASATPTFLVFSLILSTAFVMIFLRFLPTSQSLRRLEMVSLTPLLSNFGELLNGLTTVRAFRAEERFQNRVISVVDKFQGMDHFYWSLQAWLMYRFEGLSALSTFCLTVLALYTNTTPGLIAFVLFAANAFVTSTHALCKQYGQLQMDFVSVERVDELLHIEEEPPGTIDPPAAWPTYSSDIIFDDVSIRYAPHLELALQNVSLRIPGGSTTAIIGRTGSGKSTLAVSLLSAIRPETGQILMDGIDIAKVNTQALRTRVTFVAQDPVLFPGSIRLNLDPTETFSDSQCADVLDRLCGRHGWTLETQIEAGGRNLSQGQRQLIALTRAVLRRSPVVIFDEATASIDHETSLEIQQIVREELEQSTVITIAHRVEAVKDAEYYVVLDHGKVVRQGDVRDGKVHNF
ncbi:hypothetical protein N7468_009651 [Penicillium chermesinum]|uniref:ABC transporter n=1 Tax=Penicillium chermesinum TaxID=63820 RepID=A0A9W9NIC7_9EURO|nr:uncharacterized protein N7468_009651 [Penicillium chermesinum]KAJ5220447.1 hypothetical protein N7468_009651 [Penicillium chermesinum]